MLHPGLRLLTWNFCVASVLYPIIGTDLIKHYGLLPDLKGRRLIDQRNSVFTSGIVRETPAVAISTVNPGTKFAHFLAEFPEVTGLKQLVLSSNCNVQHHIGTTG